MCLTTSIWKKKENKCKECTFEEKQKRKQLLLLLLGLNWIITETSSSSSSNKVKNIYTYKKRWLLLLLCEQYLNEWVREKKKLKLYGDRLAQNKK